MKDRRFETLVYLTNFFLRIIAQIAPNDISHILPNGIKKDE